MSKSIDNGKLKKDSDKIIDNNISQSENISKSQTNSQLSTVNYQFNFGEYPKDYFDFIIIDECHRATGVEQMTKAIGAEF